MNIAAELLMEAFEKGSKINKSKIKLVEDVENKSLTESDDDIKGMTSAYSKLYYYILDQLTEFVEEKFNAPEIGRVIPEYNLEWSAEEIDGSIQEAITYCTNVILNALMQEYNFDESVDINNDDVKDSLNEADSLGDHGEEYGLLYLQLSQSIMDSLKDNVPSHITSPRILRGHVPGYNANYTSASLDGSEIFEKSCNAFTHTAVDLLLNQYDDVE